MPTIGHAPEICCAQGVDLPAVGRFDIMLALARCRKLASAIMLEEIAGKSGRFSADKMMNVSAAYYFAYAQLARLICRNVDDYRHDFSGPLNSHEADYQ